MWVYIWTLFGENRLKSGFILRGPFLNIPLLKYRVDSCHYKKTPEIYKNLKTRTKFVDTIINQLRKIKNRSL
jgi:hypothetical protein